MWSSRTKTGERRVISWCHHRLFTTPWRLSGLATEDFIFSPSSWQPFYPLGLGALFSILGNATMLLSSPSKEHDPVTQGPPWCPGLVVMKEGISCQTLKGWNMSLKENKLELPAIGEGRMGSHLSLWEADSRGILQQTSINDMSLCTILLRGTKIQLPLCVRLRHPGASLTRCWLILTTSQFEFLHAQFWWWEAPAHRGCNTPRSPH